MNKIVQQGAFAVTLLAISFIYQYLDSIEDHYAKCYFYYTSSHVYQNSFYIYLILSIKEILLPNFLKLNTLKWIETINITFIILFNVIYFGACFFLVNEFFYLEVSLSYHLAMHQLIVHFLVFKFQNIKQFIFQNFLKAEKDQFNQLSININIQK